MIIFLTEEMSMEVTIKELLKRLVPMLNEGKDFFIQSFNGKSGLEKNITKRMRAWNYGDPTFVIMKDADGGNCLFIKERLARFARASGKNFKIRIVCQELESWFLGDSEAVQAAFPRAQISNRTVKYRNPDRLTNASDELSRITGDYSKVGRATLIARHLHQNWTANHSQSFQVFRKTLVEFM